jgi:hypothetical protein
MSGNARMKPTGISWPNAPQGSHVPNSKYGAVTAIGMTHASNIYNRKNPQTAQEFREGRQSVAYNKYIQDQLARAMGALSLSGRGRKTKRRRRLSARKTHRRRHSRKN